MVDEKRRELLGSQLTLSAADRQHTELRFSSPSSNVWCSSCVTAPCFMMKRVVECGQCLDRSEEHIQVPAHRTIVLDRDFFLPGIDSHRPSKFLFIANTYYDSNTTHNTALNDCANAVASVQRLLTRENVISPGSCVSAGSSTRQYGQDVGSLESSTSAFLINRPKAKLQEEFLEFCDCIRPGDCVCVYYAGHAAQVRAQPCLVTPLAPAEASDSTAERAHRTKQSTLNIVDMVDAVAARSPRQMCFILDCAADVDVVQRRRLVTATGLPMIYELVGDRTVIIQSLSSAASLSADLLMHRDVDVAAARKCFQEESLQPKCFQEESLQPVATIASNLSSTDRFRLPEKEHWDSDDSSEPDRLRHSRDVTGGPCMWNSESSAQAFGGCSADGQDIRQQRGTPRPSLPLAQIEGRPEPGSRTLYESFFAYAKRTCTTVELAALPAVWQWPVEPCSNLSFCFVIAAECLRKEPRIDFLDIARLISKLMNCFTNNRQVCGCLTSL